MSPRFCYVMFPIEKQSGKTFYFLEKSVLLIFKFCPLSKLMFCFFFYELLISPQPTFSECIVILMQYTGQLCLSGPGYSCRTVNGVLESQSVVQIKC